MTTASHTVTFSNSCLSEGSGGSASDSDFCRKLVRDVILSPTTDRTDPCPHLFLRYYTNSMAPVEVFITQGLVNLENFVIERQHEKLVNTSGTGLSLSFCSVGDETFTWEDASTYNCPNSGDGVTVDGQNVSVPGIGVLDIHYNALYYPIEVTTFISQETTVIVCQAGKATTYNFTPDWCGSCSQYVGSQCCRDLSRALLSLGDVSLVRGTTVVIAASGGCPPYRWAKPVVHGVDFYTLSGEVDNYVIPGNPLCGGGELVTDVSAIKAVVSNDACGSGSITVTDYCGSTASGNITALPHCCSDLDLTIIGDSTFDVAQSSSTTIEVDGGQSPYSWVVAGTDKGFTFGISVEHDSTADPINNVIAAADACYDSALDSTRVRVICVDNCSRQVEFSFLPVNACP